MCPALPSLPDIKARFDAEVAAAWDGYKEILAQVDAAKEVRESSIARTQALMLASTVRAKCNMQHSLMEAAVERGWS